ncbi:MAG: hypothetical protein ABSF98_13920 [Bryobacteraceae bacterium]|jgi:hypothetical protein
MPLVIIPDVPAWQLGLLAGNLLAFVALLARVVYLRLAKSYPALALWLGVSVVVSLAPWIVPMGARFYYYFFIDAESVTLFLYLFTVLELYGKVLKGLPGLASAARRVIPVIVAASAIASGSLLTFEGRPARYLDWFYRVDRTVITSLILFVLMITAFMVWFPIRVSRNTVVYSVGYAAYLVPKGASLLLMNSGHAVRWLNGAVGMAMSAICLLFWAVALDREGETSVVSPGRLFHPREEARLLTQLEAINRTLLRAAQK